jgi:acylphosphatase
MNFNDDVGRHLLIEGVVQGIGFRWFLGQQARRLKVAGWVRNLRDGRVEAVLTGSQAAVAAVIHWASFGPPGARVERLLVEDSSERHLGFEKRPTI